MADTTTQIPYRATCALCPWKSGTAKGDDAAFELLAAHGHEAHPDVGFPGGELVPVDTSIGVVKS